MFKRVDHMEIVPRDAAATIRFYVDILGFRVVQRIKVGAPPMKEVIYIKLGDTVIEIIDTDNPQPRSEYPWQVGYRCIALEVEEMTKAVEHLQSHGVTISRPPVDLGDSFRGEILDPDGLTIELRQWKQPLE